jgi:hypothetical protein
MGDERVALALQTFDRLYRQSNGESPLQQLQVQLANAIFTGQKVGLFSASEGTDGWGGLVMAGIHSAYKIFRPRR